MTVAPFPVDAALTATTLAYKNKSYIADFVMPRQNVGKKVFRYRKFDKDTFLTIPNTLVGRKSEPNQVELSYKEETAEVFDYGLDDVIPYDDLKNAPSGYNPVQKATEYLTELIMLDREVRVASMVFNANLYATTNKQTLTGTAQFSDATSDPVGVLSNALDSCFFRPNVLVMGRQVFSVLSKHPKIVQSLFPGSGGNGIVTSDLMAQLFDVNNIYVGDAWVNSARKGGAVTLQRAWGKHIAALYVDPLAGTQDRPTFAITAEFENRVSGQIDDPKVGLRGATRVRVGESVKELIIANDLGYLIQNAVA